MFELKIKALSVNEAWQGRRYKTRKYKDYEQELDWLLPKLEIPEGNIQIDFIFGLSSKNSDLDNCLKQTIDIFSKKYNFNDKIVYKIVAEKVIVKKGQEFIKFKIKGLK